MPRSDNKKGKYRITLVDSVASRTRGASLTEAVLKVSSGEFPTFEGMDMYQLGMAIKRAKAAGRNTITGARRAAEDRLSAFKAHRLKGVAKNYYLDRFREADTGRKKNSTFAMNLRRKRKKGGITDSETFGIIERTKGSGLTGRTVHTQNVPGMIPGVDDPSHGVAMSAVTNQTAVNKKEFIFPESRVGNQGPARVVEEYARDLALTSNAGDVAMVTRTSTKKGSERPFEVQRAVLKRTKSGNNIDMQFGFAHDNDPKVT